MNNRCSLPFDGASQVKLHTGTVATCCKTPAVPIIDNSLLTKELLELRTDVIDNSLLTKELLELRTDVKNNIRNDQCASCWKIDDAGGPSFRRRFSKHNGVDWDKFDIHRPVKNIEISFSDKCQMMCAYCYPGVSTMWNDSAKDFAKFKSYIPIIPENRVDINQLANIDELEEINITGGEPMLEDRCIDFLLNLRFNPVRRLRMITNLSYGPAVFKKLEEIINRHPNISIYPSLDQIGDNPSRKYFNWFLWESNFKNLLHGLRDRQQHYADVTLAVKCVVSMLNYDRLQELVEYILSVRQQGFTNVTFDLNPLTDETVVSLCSGNIDNTKKIQLDVGLYNLLTTREKLLISRINKLIENTVVNPEMAKLTTDFLTKYNEY